MRQSYMNGQPITVWSWAERERAREFFKLPPAPKDECNIPDMACDFLWSMKCAWIREMDSMIAGSIIPCTDPMTFYDPPDA